MVPCCGCLHGRTRIGHLKGGDGGDRSKNITRPDREEWVACEVSRSDGSEALVLLSLEHMEGGKFETEVKNYQTGPDGLLVPRVACIRKVLYRRESVSTLLHGRAEREKWGRLYLVGTEVRQLQDQTGWFARVEKN